MTHEEEGSGDEVPVPVPVPEVRQWDCRVLLLNAADRATVSKTSWCHIKSLQLSIFIK